MYTMLKCHKVWNLFCKILPQEKLWHDNFKTLQYSLFEHSQQSNCNFIETFSNYIHVYTVLADANTDMGKMISNLVTEGLSYLDTRSDFWRQQKPMYARRHERLKQRRRPDVSSSKLSPNDYIIKELERIDQGKQEDKNYNTGWGKQTCTWLYRVSSYLFCLIR